MTTKTNSNPVGRMLGTAVAFALCLPGFAPASDFATTVVEYVPGSGIPVDVLTGLAFDDPAAALGRPTVDTTGDGFIAAPDAALPVLPVHPAFRRTELVSIGLGGVLTLSFGDPVLDDPANPYGLDLIVFGNASVSVSQSSSWTPSDPAGVILGSTLFQEPGEVAVSADGTNWFWMGSNLVADSFAPTLGRVYDPHHPVPLSGTSNLWWGEATDATFPLDPTVGTDSFAGTSLAAAATVYGRSAGGLGLDIGGFPLPLDAMTGHKYIRYVRISHPGGVPTPEIDAVSDVRPLSPRDLWTLDRFAWQQRSTPDVAGWYDDPDQDQRINLWEYALGSDPNVDADRPALRPACICTNGQSWLLASYSTNPEATDIDMFVEVRTDESDWTSNGVVQAWSSVLRGPDDLEITAAVPGSNTTTLVRLVVREP